jgi:hypothetical protein
MADDLLHGIKATAAAATPAATGDKAAVDGPQAARPKAAN